MIEVKYEKYLGIELGSTRIKAVLIDSDGNVGGLAAYNYLSGEHITKVSDGRPMFFRLPTGRLNLANFMKMQFYSALGTLHMGVQVLRDEGLDITQIYGHGGFKKGLAAKKLLSKTT